MGFKDFNILNSAHLAKQAWRAIHNPTALWVQVLKSVYFPNGNIIHAGRVRNDSWVWASLVHGKKMLLQQARWLVGKGEQISITQDVWLASGERVMSNLPRNFQKVSQLIDQSNCSWNIEILRILFDHQTVVKILQTPIQWFGGVDKIWWPFTRSGEYTVKTRYWRFKNQEMRLDYTTPPQENVQQKTWMSIWKVHAPQKIKIFLWKLCHDILPVKENLRKRRLSEEGVCPVYKQGPETVEHTLLQCQWTRPIWFGLQCGIRMENSNSSNITAWLEESIKEIKKLPDQREYAFLSICCALWVVSKARNSCIFEGKTPDPK